MLEEDFFDQRRTFFDWRRTFSIGVGLFLSPTVTEKKVLLQREKVLLQSQKGVGLWNIPLNLSSQVHLWSSGLWMLEEYYCQSAAKILFPKLLILRRYRFPVIFVTLDGSFLHL